MLNRVKREFVALDISSDNYLSRVLDVEIYPDTMNLGDTIKENNDTQPKAMPWRRFLTTTIYPLRLSY